MVSYSLYILQSEKNARLYIGSTEDIQKRLREHNGLAENPSRWTVSGRPWKLAWQHEFPTRSAALRAELFLKRMKSRKLLEQLIRGERRIDEFDKIRVSQ